MNTKNLTCGEIAERIISGERLSPADDLKFLTETPLEELQDGAGKIQRHFRGNHIDLCTIISGRKGNCGENCKYCAQSARHHAKIENYGLLSGKDIFQAAENNEKAGANRFSVVTSGRGLSGEDFDKMLEIYKDMSGKLKIELCASHGILTGDRLKKIRAAGVKRYHHNLETSRRYFPEICTSHTYDDRIKTIKAAQNAGLEVCSGGIIGMGETWQDRFDMAFELAGLNIKSIPVNVLIAIEGTGLEKLKPLTEGEILRTVAAFRFINPDADIRLAAGRNLLSDRGKSALLHGASASITGNMLTVPGNSVKLDLELLKSLGLTNGRL